MLAFTPGSDPLPSLVMVFLVDPLSRSQLPHPQDGVVLVSPCASYVPVNQQGARALPRHPGPPYMGSVPASLFLLLGPGTLEEHLCSSQCFCTYKLFRVGVVAHTCNPALRRPRQKDPELEANLNYTVKSCLKQ